MKRFTQVICMVLILSMVLAMPAFAAGITPRASDYFMSHSCYLWRISSTQFQVWFDVAAVKGMDEIGASSISVQRSDDGDNWETVQTYSRYDYPNLICKDTGTHGSYVTYYNAEPGYYYRARVDFYAKLGNGSASYIDYTSSLSY